MDRVDKMILSLIQEDATLPVADIAKRVGLSTTPCWRRIQKMEEDRVIERRVAVLNPEKINVGVTVFVSIITAQAQPRMAEALCRGDREVSGGRRLLPHERAGGLPAEGRGARYRGL